MNADKKQIKKLNIVFASHTFIGGTFVVGSHHLAREFSELGNNVLHISTPLSPLHFIKLNNKIVRTKFKRAFFNPSIKIGQSLIDLIPFTLLPWQLNKYLKISENPSLQFLTPSISYLMRKNGMDNVDVLLIDQPSFQGIEKYVKPKIIIYRATDLYRELTGNNEILTYEKKIASISNGIVGTSQPVLNHLKSLNDKIPSKVLENGVEYNHFANQTTQPKEYNGITGLKVVYAGAVDERLDISAIEFLAQKLTNVSVIIIGPDSKNKLDKLRKYNNVHILGPRPYSKLPAYLEHADIGILPLSDHFSNTGRSPMKLYEYGAAGIPVVVTATPELLRRNEKFIFHYYDYEEFISIVSKLDIEKLDSNMIKKEVKVHSWESKAKELLDFIMNI
ncbi:glycosyltransferase [Gracilibacillus massiliensis]|uniref:glycosyltransferase n=1 Tax=Gracilibacillus massiliensis TaxID=1564956 RepID=UPI00071E33FB|nr:glycosyltransferase [Gracilibacillus massiliensis]